MPSPKPHRWLVIVPVERPVKATVNGTVPESGGGEAVEEVAGAENGGVQ